MRPLLPNHVRSNARLLLAFAVALLAAGLTARAALITPAYNAGSSAADGTHDPDDAGPTAAFVSAIGISTPGAALTAPFAPHSIAFTGGSTKANAGIGRTQSSTSAKAVFASGMGVDQSDPGHVQPTSSFLLSFTLFWDIVGGTFGPPISGGFSIPVGVKTGAAGSAGIDIHVRWNMIKNGVVTFNVRTPYDAVMAWGANTNLLTNFTSPASAFSPSSLTDGPGTDQFILTGNIKFSVNNDIDPASIEIPQAANISSYQLLPGQQFNDFLYEPFMDLNETVPEPSSAMLMLVPATGLLMRRRQKTRR